LDSTPIPAADRRVSLLLLGAAAFMVASDARVIDPLLKTIAADFSSPLTKASLAVSAYALPYGLFQLAYGPLGDRIGKVRVMAFAFTLFTLGTAACALVPTGISGLSWLIALRFITGVFAAAIIPLSIAYIGDKVAPDKRQATLGQFMSSLMMGTVFSGPIGGVFGDYLGWRNIFLLLGGISALVMVAFIKAARDEPRPVRDPGKPSVSVLKGYAMVLSNPNSLVVYPAIFLEGLFLFGGFVYVSSALQDNFGMKILQAGLLISFYGIGGLVYSFTAKRILKQLKQLQMALLGGTLLMCGFVTASLLPRLNAWWPIIPAAMLIGFGFNSIHSTLQTKATELAVKARGTAVSLFAFFFFLGQSLGVQGGGALGLSFAARGIEDKLIPGYWIVFLTSGVGLFLMSLWVASRLPKMTQEQQALTPASGRTPTG
jgi:predicted MFS family arabinose efflux permease